jgi:ribosomal protein L7Ae-like RNA K-turn-binding protein
LNHGKMQTYIGLAMRAGACKCGENACKTALLKGEADILLVNESMSEGTRNKMVSICNECNIPVLTIPAEAEIGAWAGRPGSLCMIINNKGLAGEIMKTYKDVSDDNRGVNQAWPK